jgi:membrane associated rhomboid family serine protease
MGEEAVMNSVGNAGRSWSLDATVVDGGINFSVFSPSATRVELAFGMLFPSRTIVLIFPPIPMPAIVFVIIYGLIELFSGIFGTQQGVAHFAHLGGMCWALTSPFVIGASAKGPSTVPRLQQ